MSGPLSSPAALGPSFPLLSIPALLLPISAPPLLVLAHALVMSARPTPSNIIFHEHYDLILDTPFLGSDNYVTTNVASTILMPD